MKRLYFDWLVFSKLKQPEFGGLKQFLLDNSNRFIIPFTPAHFKDSERSHQDPRFLQDLDMMTALCEEHFMFYHDDTVLARAMSPKEALELYVPENSGEKEEPFDFVKALDDFDRDIGKKGFPQYGRLMKAGMQASLGFDEKNAPSIMKVMFPSLNANSTMMDLVEAMMPLANDFFTGKSRYLAMRDSIAQDGVSLAERTLNISTPAAVQEIKTYLNTHLKVDSYQEFVDNGFKHQENAPDELTWFIQAYQMLDLLGFKPDLLSKPTNTVMNIRHDGEHAFYASFCDYLVTDDKKFKAKAEALYLLLDIPTRVVDPKELVSVGQQATLLPPADLGAFVDQVIDDYNNGLVVVREKVDEDKPFERTAVEARLPILDYFTHIICDAHSDLGAALLVRKVVYDRKRFAYPKEVRLVLRQIITTFGGTHIQDLEAVITELMTSEDPPSLKWIAPDLVVIVEMEKGLFRPAVRIFAFTEHVVPVAQSSNPS